MLLLNRRPKVTLNKGTTFILLLLLLLLLLHLMSLLWVSRRGRLLNLLNLLLRRCLLNLLLLNDWCSRCKHIGIVNNLALIILMSSHVNTHYFIVAEDTQTDWAFGMLRLQFSNLFWCDIIVCLHQMLVE